MQGAQRGAARRPAGRAGGSRGRRTREGTAVGSPRRLWPRRRGKGRQPRRAEEEPAAPPPPERGKEKGSRGRRARRGRPAGPAPSPGEGARKEASAAGSRTPTRAGRSPRPPRPERGGRARGERGRDRGRRRGREPSRRPAAPEGGCGGDPRPHADPQPSPRVRVVRAPWFGPGEGAEGGREEANSVSWRRRRRRRRRTPEPGRGRAAPQSSPRAWLPEKGRTQAGSEDRVEKPASFKGRERERRFFSGVCGYRYHIVKVKSVAFQVIFFFSGAIGSRISEPFM